ncbi:protein-disulfide reductase DsbD domain-containing protein [Rhodovulum marinum]|uniref:Disulfide bond corrector protein DsbC n=1 Tax=Rhodovulum marinum TaxID=320662 RepID=A0A4R2QC67_9RHOB|nr:protein-disulfide reductase DsbD domain-containing protein [Rhodovulum marinum]TCP44495.1 disulfide bond corrector protein DsbC [Rhodovulum marinum]
MRFTAFHRLAAAAAVALGLGQTALAGPPEGVVSAEFLPGWQTPEGTYMAGLHLRMAPGWKTYWRAPGDAGIPPRFDWAGSGNMASVRVHWPRPKVFQSNGLRTIGYEHDVVLPIELTPREPGQPMELHGRVEIGVCHDICMPMELRLSGLLPGEGGSDAIRAALAQRPLSAREARVGHVNCQVEPISDGVRLTAEIEVGALGPNEAVVFELPDPSIWVSEAAMTRDGGRIVAQSDLVPVDGAPFALDRSGVRITVLGTDRAVDIRGCTGR